jgi:hypothetical protein
VFHQRDVANMRKKATYEFLPILFLTTRQTMWVVEDMAPAHLRREVNQVLNSHYVDPSMWQNGSFLSLRDRPTSLLPTSTSVS